MTDKTTEFINSITLSIDKWTAEDIKNFKKSEKLLIGDKKSCDFEKKVVNTSLGCFGKTNEKAKTVSRIIKKGNYISFLDNLKIENHFESILCCYLVSFIKDFDDFKRYLLGFLETVDNWASCDSLSFSGKNRQKLLELSFELLKSDKVFFRRVGVRIFFELIKDASYFEIAFNAIDGLKEEKEYYVNMCAAWLLCECFIKHREQTLLYFKSPKTNDFIINKAISKCRDSFRVSKEDKKMLDTFKR